MKKKYQNGFLIFGVAVLILMVTQLDFKEVWQGLRSAGYWFFAVVALWMFLYMFNTTTWYIIIRSGDKHGESTKINFWWLYKITVSGFALNYATPGGLMGGEPYRIMSLAPKIGTERASSSVILFAMTHIFSHFWFWLISIVLFLLFKRDFIDVGMGILLAAAGAFCLLGLWFFIVGYRKGLAVRAMNLLRHIPFVKKWALRFLENHREQLDNIDNQIAALHRQNPRTFVMAVLSDLSCRIVSALEIYFCLKVLYPSVDYINCILILAFTSLFANLLFFIPLQLGGREGGFLMSARGLALTASDGIFVALIIRIREIIWTAIGLLLIKFEKRHEEEKNEEAQGTIEEVIEGETKEELYDETQ